MPKKFLTYESQLNKLKDKGMIIPDEEYAKKLLHRYGYFALISGYKDLLKNPTTRNYRDGTTFQDIVAIYRFDEQLRELTFHYLIQIERHIRSALSYAFCDAYGDNQAAYLSAKNYDTVTSAKAKDVTKLIGDYLTPLATKSTEHPYIEHQRRNHGNVPLWALVNALTFGTLSKMYECSTSKVQATVSKEFEGINEAQLRQILKVLTNFRNVCAHGERLFTYKVAKFDIPNLPLHQKLRIPKRGTDYTLGKRDYFAVVLSFRYLLSHEEFLTFKAQLSRLIAKVTADNQKIELPDLLRMMGFPENWKKVTTYKK